MNPHHVLLTLKKELRETVRDRRTLAVMVLFPLVIYPLLAVLITQVTASREGRIASKPSRVSAPAGDVLATDLVALASAHPETFTWVADKAEADVDAHDLDAFVTPNPPAATDAPITTGQDVQQGGDPEAVPGNNTSRPITVIYDGTREESRLAMERLSQALTGRLPPACHAVFALHSHDLASAKKTGGYLLSKALPLLIVLMLMLGAFYPAIDTTAGERERGTLETTLVAPVRRFDLLLGKVLAVAALALVTGVLNLASMSMTLVRAFQMARPDLSLPIPWDRVAIMSLVLVPSALLFAALMVAVATSTRSFKEAQNLLTPLYFLFLVPAVVANLAEYDLSPGLALVPGMNVTLLARDLTLGRAAPAMVTIVMASTVLYTGLALALAARLYDPERLLASADPHRGDNRPRRSPTAAWNAGDALILFVVGFVLLFLMAPLQARHRELGVLASQWVGMFGLTVVYGRLRRQPVVSQVIGVRRSPWGAVLGAFIMGVSAWMAVGLLTEWLLPAPKEVIERLKETLLAQGERPLFVTVLVVGLTPAICEETLFRGGILRGLGPRLGSRMSIVVCGLMFAIYHLDPYRLLPTFALGLMLSWIAVQARSTVPAMVAHFTNNTVLILIASQQADAQLEDIPVTGQAVLFTMSVAVSLLGAWLLKRSVRDQSH